jgi:DMSO reductase anchor subunit
MAQIYVLPSQPFWNSILTPISFLITTFLLGVVTVPVLFMMDLIFNQSQEQKNSAVHAQMVDTSLGPLAVVAVLLCILTAAINYFQIASLVSGSEAAQTSLNILLSIYQPLLIIRLAFLFVGVGWLVVTAVQQNQKKLSVDGLLMNVFISCLLVMVVEILGRFLFFAIHVRVGI